MLMIGQDTWRVTPKLTLNYGLRDNLVQPLYEKDDLFTNFEFDAYDPAQPFTPWACRFALNKARQWIEGRQKWQALLEGGLAEELAHRREELRPDLESRLKHLERCLGKLSTAQRSLVESYYYHRANIEQLSESSGRTVAATYKALQRIRQSLLACVEHAAQRESAA